MDLSCAKPDPAPSSYHQICDPLRCDIVARGVRQVPGDEALYNSRYQWMCAEYMTCHPEQEYPGFFLAMSLLIWEPPSGSARLAALGALSETEAAPALEAAEAGAGAIPSTSSLADDLANATGGAAKVNKGGYTVNVPNGSRGITVRIMDEGGGRTNYYRVSVPGKETYTIDGTASTDPALTHIDIRGSSLSDILSIINKIQGGG